nr:unnamed protein product [Callosobruchus chinensis]
MTPIENIAILKQKIIDAAEKMRQNLRISVVKTNLRKQLRMCVRNNGGHVENELKSILLILYKAKKRPGLEYCSHVSRASVPTTVSILDAVQQSAVRLIEEHGLSQQLTSSFLRSSGLKSESEGFIIACQDGVFNTLVYRSRVMGRCRIYWNYSFPTLELLQANKPDIVFLDHQQKTMFVIEFSAPAEMNIVSKEEEKRTKYQELLGQLRRLWPDYTVSVLVMVIGSLGGMRNTLHSALRAMLVCRAAAHILAARMQKAVILGSLGLLRAHDTRTQ